MSNDRRSGIGDVAKVAVLGAIVINCFTGAALLTETIARAGGRAAWLEAQSVWLAAAGALLAVAAAAGVALGWWRSRPTGHDRRSVINTPEARPIS